MVRAVGWKGRCEAVETVCERGMTVDMYGNGLREVRGRQRDDVERFEGDVRKWEQ